MRVNCGAASPVTAGEVDTIGPLAAVIAVGLGLGSTVSASQPPAESICAAVN